MTGSELELKKVTSTTKKQAGRQYNQIGQADQTIDDADEDELAVSMEADDPRLEEEIGTDQTETRTGGSHEPVPADDDDNDEEEGEYDDDIDAELDNLEQSVRGDDEDDDTDEDDGRGQPDYAPYDHSLKKKAGAGARTTQ